MNNLIIRKGTDDEIIIREIIHQNMFHFEYLSALIHQYPMEFSLLDIGAHIGIFSAVWHQNFPEHPIHCIEPAPANYALLQKNCSGHQFTLHPFALADATGTGFLHLEHPHFTGRWKLNEHLTKTQINGLTVEVPLVDINQFLGSIEKSGLVIKIDVEGAEYALLRAIKAEHWQNIHVLIVEWHDQPMQEVFFSDLGLIHLFNPKSQDRHAVYVRPVLQQDWVRIALETQRSILSQQHQDILYKVQTEAAFNLKNLSKRLLNRLKTFFKK